MFLFKKKFCNAVEIIRPQSFIISRDKIEEYYFCFTGELGYELISWIPYILFLKNKLNIKIKTIGRPGSKVFYYFSDEHIEVEAKYISYSWGQKENYQKIIKKLNNKKIIYYSNQDSENKKIIIEGHEWKTKDIHTKIDTKCYEKIKFPDSKQALPFATEKKIVVINNKYNIEWGLQPINFFSREDLINLKEILNGIGYFIVYNFFKEKTSHDIQFKLNDEGIFVSEECFDMNNYYLSEPDINKRNKMQLKLFKEAEFVIGVQGGNVYLPAIQRKSILMLMRKGDYIDYTEIARLYGIKINVFYESQHIIEHIIYNTYKN